MAARRCCKFRKAEKDDVRVAGYVAIRCRLAQKPRDISVVAAALIMHAERMNGVTRTFHEIATLLQVDESHKGVNIREVRPVVSSTCQRKQLPRNRPP